MTQIASNLSESLISAAKYFNDGQFERADFICRNLVKNEPANADALHLLALIAARRNRLSDSIKLLKEACKYRPDDYEFLTNLGNLMKANGDYREAGECYKKAIALQPSGLVASHNLALLLAAQGDFEQSITVYRDSIAINQNVAELHIDLSGVLKAVGKLKEAIESCQNALSINGNSFEARIHLANLYFAENNPLKALSQFEQAAQLKPKEAIVFNGIGVCQTALGNFSYAKSALLKAVELTPNLADAQNNLALVHFILGEYDYAIICLKVALKLNPNYAEAWRNYANILANLNDYISAIDFYKKALQIAPDFYEAQLELATAYKNSGDMQLAKTSFIQAQKILSNALVPRCGLIGASLPSFYENIAEIDACRSGYINGLTDLEKHIESGKYTENELEEALPLVQPYYLSYQGMHDLVVHKRYGQLLHNAMVKKYPSWSQEKIKRNLKAGEKIRLGIVSHNLNNHVDWKIITSGLINHIDRDCFELYAYSTGGKEDEITNLVKDKVNSFFRGTDVASIGKRIEQDNIDILFFPELGIDPLSMKLASLRLAPIQCSGWGRADTSGLPTIDYFFSPQIMEPNNAQSNYQEKLLLIPETGFYYEPQSVLQEPHMPLFWDENRTKFLCIQSLFKYMPQYDKIFVQIAKNISDAQFIFIARPEALAEKFLQRLNKEFVKAGLDAYRFVKVLLPLNYSQFVNLSNRADIFLDSIGYSGCLTVLDVIEQNVPIVTMDGALLRGRQSAGILRFLGLDELIAGDIDMYVNKAIKLARDIEYRNAIRQIISENKALLYRNQSVIKYMENTFKSWFLETHH